MGRAGACSITRQARDQHPSRDGLHMPSTPPHAESHSHVSGWHRNARQRTLVSRLCGRSTLVSGLLQIVMSPVILFGLCLATDTKYIKQKTRDRGPAGPRATDATRRRSHHVALHREIPILASKSSPTPPHAQRRGSTGNRRTGVPGTVCESNIGFFRSALTPSPW